MNENKCNVVLEKAIDFSRHTSACRICLRSSERSQEMVKITENIRTQYFMLIQSDVRL